MECPRCGEENLPGLLRCFQCGADLGDPGPADEPEPLPTLPRARTRNPLERRAPPRRQFHFPALGARLHVRTAHRLFLRAAGYAFRGLVPGLDPALRRSWLEAAAWVGAFLFLLLMVWVGWRSPVSDIAWYLTLSLICSSAATATWRRLGVLAVRPRVIVAALASVMAFSISALVLLTVVRQRFYVYTVPEARPFLEAGSYVVDRRFESCPALGDLVVFGEPGWYRAQGLSKVVAVAGQSLEMDNSRNLFVDGRFLDLEGLAGENRVYIEMNGGFKVPPAHIVLLSNEIRATQCGHLQGHVIYRLQPANRRGSMENPP